jgi:hypothetical protein
VPFDFAQDLRQDLRQRGASGNLIAAVGPQVRVSKEALALVAFTADNHSGSRFVPGLLETFFELARNLPFPFSMAMALINGIPFNQLWAYER